MLVSAIDLNKNYTMNSLSNRDTYYNISTNDDNKLKASKNASLLLNNKYTNSVSDSVYRWKIFCESQISKGIFDIIA